MESQSNTEVKMGSERSFGLVFAAVFFIIAAYPILHGNGLRIWAFVVAAIFLVLALTAPNLLKPLNKLWFQVGLLLNKIVSPIVMGIVFFVTVVPIGLILKARGKDPLNRKLDPSAETYWITIDPNSDERTSMKKQF